MTTASKFRRQSPLRLAKLRASGALSSSYPMFQGMRLQMVQPCEIQAKSQVQVRFGALVDSMKNGEVVPHKGRRPVQIHHVIPEVHILIARTHPHMGGTFGENICDLRFETDYLYRVFRRMGIVMPGSPMTNSDLIEARDPNRGVVRSISDWLNPEQIKILVAAGRIRFVRNNEGKVAIYLVAPARAVWAGEKGYWKEVSVEDCTLVG